MQAPAFIIHELENNLEVFKNLFNQQNESAYRWRPQSGKWNLLEILCHLYDEEREDFRYRTRHLLEHPEKPMPGFDPVALVLTRGYANQDYESRLQEFLKERKESLQWLASLENPHWDNHYTHSVFGKVSAQFFLNNWLAHDYLHIRQIIRLKFAYLEEVGGLNLEYAGGW